MAAKRLFMRKVREVLRLRWSCGRSPRDTARSLSLSSSAVCECVRRARAAGLDWPQAQELNYAELEPGSFAATWRKKDPIAVPRGDPYFVVCKERTRMGIPQPRTVSWTREHRGGRGCAGQASTYTIWGYTWNWECCVGVPTPPFLSGTTTDDNLKIVLMIGESQ